MFKITSLNSISVFIKIGIGLITSKLFAVFLGPNGMALVGNFRNFIASIESLSTLGMQNGIVKFVAENESDKVKISKIISTVFISLLVITLIISCSLMLFSNYLNDQIFGNNFHYKFIFKTLALLLPWYATSLFLLAVINGFGAFKNVIYINIIGNIFGLFVSSILIFQFKTSGALLSIIISPSLLFFVTIYYINQKINFLKTISFHNYDFKIIKYLSSYSLMALVVAIVSPAIFIIIRNEIISTIGINQAGFWESITRISSYYLMFATSILSIYFLPKLSISKSNIETKSIFLSFYKFIIPFFIIGLTIIYFLRFFIIKTLFTAEFMPVTDLFFWQLIGDLIKICSWILAFNLLAKKQTLAYIIIELFSLLTTYFSSLYFLQLFGIQGIVIAHAFTYLAYLIVLVVFYRKILFLNSFRL